MRETRTIIDIALILIVSGALIGCATEPPPYRDTSQRQSSIAMLPRPTSYRADATAEDIEELGDSPQLENYLRYAALNNPALEAAFLQWRAALERAPQSRALPEPRLTYRYYIEEVETRVGPQRQAFGIAQSFPWPGTLRLKESVATEAARAAKARYEAEKLAVFNEVKQAYYDVAYLGRAIEIVAESKKLLAFLEKVIRARYRVAAAKHPDLIRVQVELAKVDDRLHSLRDLRHPMTARLNSALNRPEDAPVPWPKSIGQPPLAASDEQVLAWLRESNPELLALEYEAGSAREAASLAGKKFFPDITLGLDYIDTSDALGSGMRDSGKDPIIGMISLTLPLWQGKYRAAEREARARQKATLKTRANRNNHLGARVKMALFEGRDSERKISLHRDVLIPKGQQSMKATEAAYRAGNAGVLDLVDAQRLLLEFQLSYERAVADHAKAIAELEMLVGRELPLRGDGSDEERKQEPAFLEKGEKP